MFNASHIEHLIIGIALQMTIGVCIYPFQEIGFYIASGIVTGIFLGREISQNEYWFVRHEVVDSIKKIPWYYGIKYNWDSDSILDILVPFTGTMGVAFVIDFITNNYFFKII